MRRGLGVFLLGGALSAVAAEPPSPATGFGSDTAGGRGGVVIKVTTLAATGPGSLRAALEARGPRIVVFEVGGAIDLGRATLEIREPFVTIAGQTAPAPGITLIRGGMRIATHDVRMEHLRIRIGDAGMAKKSGYERDVSIEGANAYRVVVDHCSVSWGTDENLSVSGPRYDGPQGTAHQVTLSHNIVAEGLFDSSHSKGGHSMGSLVHDEVRQVAITGNLYAHNFDRNPWYKGGASGVVINNFIYNPGRWAIRLGYVPGEWRDRAAPMAPQVAIVGNVMQHGENTQSGLGLVGTNSAQGEAYLHDNLAFDRLGMPVAEDFGGITRLEAPPSWAADWPARPASTVREWVLANAGARPAERDETDRRLVEDIRAGRGRLLNSQDEVGGYPAPAPTRRTLNVPEQGIDAWLERFRRVVEGRANPSDKNIDG